MRGGTALGQMQNRDRSTQSTLTPTPSLSPCPEPPAQFSTSEDSCGETLRPGDELQAQAEPGDAGQREELGL